MRFLLLLFLSVSSLAAQELDDRTLIALEAIKRLENTNLESNPALQKALDRLLDKTKGTSHYVDLVRKFNLKDKSPALLEIALASNSPETRVEAVRTILDSGDSQVLAKVIASGDTNKSAALISVIGDSRERKALPLLLPLVISTNQPASLRKSALKGLINTQPGAAEVLNLAEQGNLASDLRLQAAIDLNNVRWGDIKTRAATILPPPQNKGSSALPPTSELVKMKGNPKTGELLYFKVEVACSTCHVVRGKGTEIGPNLSEIGSKLGKDAIIDAILDPNAGVSFGFEAHSIELKNGDELYGLKVSETETDISIKDLRGLVTRAKKSDIAKHQQLKNSIMPAGLQASMTTQEFVDLVEFLASLKK